MIVALDFDRTYARAPGLFNPMIDEASRARSLSVWCITRREDTPENRQEIKNTFGERFALLGGLILCGPNMQKEDAARAAGITVDVWIDDSPEKIPAAGYRGGESRDIYDDIDFTPPAGVREEAARALAWRREFGRGGTEVGIARARDLSNGVTISPDTARRMVSYFARHEVDKQGEGFSPGEPGFPSNGRIAWGLWGGDPGQAWSAKLARQMDARDESATNQRSNPMNIERRTLLNTAVSFPAIRVEKRSEEVIVDGAPQRVERDWCVGYASVFGLLSLDLGDFVERIDSRAFDKVLARRGDDGVATRALWNHNSDYPLGRHPETLTLTPDEKGLRYEFPFGRASYAQDLRFNIDDGIVKGSSFGFVVAPGGERWSKEQGRNVRTVMEIEALYDVSPTTYPAYPESDVAVAKRSFHHAMESGLVKPQAKPAPRRSVALREFLSTHGRKVG
jgi:HK97 family phage prohead protease